MRLVHEYFTLLKLQVILHTYIDSLRVDEDREVNQHGQPRKVTLCTKVAFEIFLPGGTRRHPGVPGT